MFRKMIFAIALVHSLCSGAVLAGDEAKGIFERAIKAHGGKANLAKLRKREIITEGTVVGVLGQKDSKYKSEETWEHSLRYRSLMYFDGKLVQTFLINEEHVFVNNAGLTMEWCKDYYGEIKANWEAQSMRCPLFWTEDNMKLSMLKDAQVCGKATTGILVKRKNKRDVKLFFEKTSGLLLKLEFKGHSNAAAGMAVYETIFSDYKEKDGVKHYTKKETFLDGEKTGDARVIEIRLLEKLDSSIFDIPKK